MSYTEHPQEWASKLIFVSKLSALGFTIFCFPFFSNTMEIHIRHCADSFRFKDDVLCLFAKIAKGLPQRQKKTNLQNLAGMTQETLPDLPTHFRFPSLTAIFPLIFSTSVVFPQTPWDSRILFLQIFAQTSPLWDLSGSHQSKISPLWSLPLSLSFISFHLAHSLCSF